MASHADVNEPDKKIAFVTNKDWPELTPDDHVAAQCLRLRGADCFPIRWDSVDVNWKSFDLIVIRSCWDYHKRVNAFLGWIEYLGRLELPFWNPPDVIRWNYNKFYLKSLQDVGVKIPPTVFLTRETEASLSELIKSNGWEKAVVKPAVSATAYQTWIAYPEKNERHEENFRAMLHKGGVLVQEFQDEIVRDGEWVAHFF